MIILAEIIESSLNIWKARNWEWDKSPAFGSLVAIRSKERVIYGIVHDIQTGSLDPNRTVIAYKKSEEELKKEQPQIFEFLQTNFSCLTLGYKQEGILLYQLAPEPPKIHAFVGPASLEETIEFYSNEQYLHLLFSFSNHIFCMDELLIALIKNLSDLEILNKKNFEQFVKTFSLLTGNDYRRLKLFLQRVKPILKIS